MEQGTVFVVDDEVIIRKALKLLLRSVGLSVETYASADEFLQAFNPDRYGCLVLDVRMPGMSGLELQQELRARQSHIPIIFLTAHADVSMSVRAMKFGAVDFIEKPFNDQDLLDAIRVALHTGKSTREQRFSQRSATRLLKSLSRRENEVMKLLVGGRSAKHIAVELGISEKTVAAHRLRLLEKLNLSSVVELVHFAAAAGDGDGSKPKWRPQ